MSGEAFGLRPFVQEHSGQCADCDATTELVQAEDRVWILEIRHSQTCPAYTAMTRAMFGDQWEEK